MAQQDIAGFRRSHKRIPTSVALKDDQEEMLAKQAALGRMGQSGAAKAAQTGPKKSLSSYQGVNAVGRRESGPIGQPPLPNQPGDRMRRDARMAAESQGIPGSDTLPGMNVIPDMGAAEGTVRTATGGFGSPSVMGKTVDQKDPGDPFGLRESLQQTYDRLNDQEAAEERVARARAAQAAAVRSAMGTGETAMSGAAALLEGDAGRMAESQARAAELAQDLDVAALGSALLGFDVTKDRYDKAEKAQAATAVMHTMMEYDITYEEAFELLGLPKSAMDEEFAKTVNEWGRKLTENAEKEDKEEEDAAENAAISESFTSLLDYADGSEHAFTIETLDGDTALVINTSIDGVSVPAGFEVVTMGFSLTGESRPQIEIIDGEEHYVYKDNQGRFIFVRTDRTGQPAA